MTHAPATTTRKDESRVTAGPSKSTRPGGNHSAPSATGVPRWMQTRADGYDAAGPMAAFIAANPAQVTGRDGAGLGARDLVEQPMPSPPQGSSIRAKLEVGGVDDPEEHEADSLASAALANSGKASCASGGTSPSFSGSDKVRRKADAEGGGRPAGMEGFGSGIGRPLDRATRAFFEPRFGADLGAVRIHDDRSTRMRARSMGARAFTVGADIGFADGELSPHTSDGRFLLAHELAHVSRGHGGVRRDIPDDLEGRPSVPLATAATRPPGTIRYQLPSGDQVYAPYGIYQPEQVPTWLHGLTMESSQALVYRYPDQFVSDIYDQVLAGNIPNPKEVTIGDMVRYAEQQGPGYNLRLLIALVNGGYRFLGYDTSYMGGGLVYTGFIESNRAPGVGRTGGVGQALFADRVTRALAGGASEMSLEVGLSEDTEKFHEAIWRIAGITGSPQKYELDTRQMVRIALAWSDVLSPAERQELVRFAVMQGNPSAAEVQAVLARTAPSGGGATPAAGTPGLAEAPSGEMIEMMRRFLNELRSNLRQPAEVESLRQLQEPETQDKVMRDHAGFALAEGRLYRLEPVGQAVRITEVTPEPIIQPVAEPLGPGPVVEPVGGRVPPQMLNLDPTRALRIGETVIPPSEGNPAELQEGDFLVVGYERALEAVDPVTQRPLLGVYEGGRWYMIVGENMRGLDFDPETGMRIETLQTEGGPVRAVELATDLPSQTALQRAPVSTTAVGVASIIMLANDILKWMGASLQVQRATIEAGKAEIDLWSRLGAAPVPGIWDADNMEPAAHGTKPDTSLRSKWYFPYVADINADLLRTELPRRVHSYSELAVLLASMGQLNAFQQEPDGRMMAVVNRPQGAPHLRYDITEAIRTVEALTLASAESGLRERLALRPAAERQGRIRRLHPGATLLRSMGEGLFNTQPLIGAGDRLGPNAWVREIRRSMFGNKLFVEPVNADAHQAVALAAYVINQDLEDVWRECKKGGREVHPAELPDFGDGPLTGFQAGPETTGDQRFGWTRYEKKPDNPAWTVAFGELRAFWVSAGDTTVVTDDEVEAYLRK